MTDVISTRLDENEVEELNVIAKRERMDRSSLIRKFLLTQMAEYRMKAAGEKYRKGIVSLAEAATLARVSLYRMMEYVDREKIRPPAMTEQEMEEELKRTDELFKKMDASKK